MNTITLRHTAKRWGITLIMFTLIFGYANAAEIRADPRRERWGAILEGVIEKGDASKLEKYIDPDHMPVQLFLASPGGDLIEAMKIGTLARKLKITTVIPENYDSELNALAAKRFGIKDFKNHYICASACFLIYIAGIYLDSAFSGLKKPLLGIHKPYLAPDDLMSLDGDQAIIQANNTKKLVETYLSEMGIKHKYIDEMFSIPKDSLRWISQDEFSHDFRGFIPQLKDWADARCDKFTTMENKIWAENAYRLNSEMTANVKEIIKTLILKRADQVRCEQDLAERLSVSAYLEYFNIK